MTPDLRRATALDDLLDSLYRAHRHDECPVCGSTGDHAVSIKGVTASVICGECDALISEFDIDDPAEEAGVWY